MKLSVVIPAYNEESGIGPTLDSIPVKELEAAGYKVEKLVVDNASSDHTAEVARAHGARVVFQPKRGYGNAYKAGFDHAKGDIIATGDADMTYPFEALPAILAKLKAENLEFINTDRLSRLNPGVMRPMHVFGNHLLSLVMRLLFRTPFKDSQSGMWIFRRYVWPQVEAHHHGMPFSQEIKVEAFAKGFRCGEHQITYGQRIGEVKLSVVDAWRTMSELFKKRLSIRSRPLGRSEGLGTLGK